MNKVFPLLLLIGHKDINMSLREYALDNAKFQPDKRKTNRDLSVQIYLKLIRRFIWNI